MIDVIIPTYNNGKYLKEALWSVSEQTLAVNKVFVVDDGSTDNTAQVIASCKELLNIDIVYIKQNNAGPNSARNNGLSHSEAEYIAFLDADDVWVSNKLAKQMEVFNNSPFDNLGLVYGRYDTINENGGPSTEKVLNIDNNYRRNAYSALLKANKILGSASCVLIKKDVFDHVGTFDESLRYAEDWEMWLRISNKYNIDYIDEVLVHIRRHPLNNSKSRTKQIVGLFKFYKKLLYQTKNPILVSSLIIKRFF